MDQNAALNVQLLQAQRRRVVLGHFHMPYKPSRLRMLWWRIFRPAVYRKWKLINECSYVVGHAIAHGHDYNKGPSAWLQPHAAIIGHGPRQLVTIGSDAFREITPEEAQQHLERYRAAYPEVVGAFRAYHGDVKPKP